MPYVKLTRRYRFAASHRLHTPLLDDARNREVYGKCNNPYGHGHDYVLEVTVAGESDAATGRLLNLGDLDLFIERVILKEVAYKDLNAQLGEFSALVPTTENLATVVAARLTAAWAGAFPSSPARLEMVRIRETRRNIFEVRVNPSRSA
jgi:6-pyruvoyltetrahydropterin/6-carboxytetrahydropterin synthase